MDVDVGLLFAWNNSMGSLHKEWHTQVPYGVYFSSFKLVDAYHMFRSATVYDYLPMHSHWASGGMLFDMCFFVFLPAMAFGGSSFR